MSIYDVVFSKRPVSSEVRACSLRRRCQRPATWILTWKHKHRGGVIKTAVRHRCQRHKAQFARRHGS